MASFRSKSDSTTGEIVGFEEALAKINLELMNPVGDKLRTLTDVTPQEIFGLSILYEYQKVFKSNIIGDFLAKFLQMRISRLRLGRREFVSIGTGMSEYVERRKQSKGGGGNIFSGMG